MKKRHFTVCTLALPLVLTDPAWSQSVGDIVVTAQRREQRLQDVPLAVTALDADTLHNRNISSVADLGTGKVPGLSVGSIFGAQTSVSLNFRGLASSDPSQGTMDSPAAFYIDGINLPRGQGLALELITPERIEVMRGPQGQLFGRNAEGGAVQIISRRPTGEWDGEFTAGLGEFGTRYARSRLDLPALAGFRVQLSAFGREHDGYIKNKPNPLLKNIQPIITPGSDVVLKRGNYDRDLGFLNSYGGRVAVERDFGPLNVFYTYDNSYAKENYNYTHFENAPAVAGTLNNPDGVNTPALIFTLQPDLMIFSQDPIDWSKYPTTAAYANYVAYYVIKSRGHALTLTHDTSDKLTLKSITGYRHVSSEGTSSNNAAVSTVNPLSNELMDSKAFSQEFQAIYSVDRLNITAGAIYFREKVHDQRDAFFAANCAVLGPIVTPCTPIGQPTRPPYVSPFNPAGVTDLRIQSSTTNAYAAYAQASFTPPILNDALEITAGLRYSNNTKRGRRTVSFGALLPTPITNEAKADRFDPALSLKLEVAPDVNIYGRYARGFRDGGANVRSDIFSAFKLETLTSYEVGLKSQFLDRRVTLNMAAFHNTLKNFQLQVQTDPANRPGTGDTMNLPFSLKMKGIEGELSVRPLDGLSISASGTYLDSPGTYFVGIEALAPNQLGVFIPNVTYNPVTGMVPDAATVAAHPNSTIIGANMAFAPKWSWSLGGDYKVPVHNDIKLRLHADWTKSTNFYTSAVRHLTPVANGTATPKPTYNRPSSTNSVNLRIAAVDIPVDFGTVEIAFWGKNVFNTVKPAFTFGSGNGLSAAAQAAQSTILLAPPRVLGGEVRVIF